LQCVEVCKCVSKALEALQLSAPLNVSSKLQYEARQAAQVGHIPLQQQRQRSEVQARLLLWLLLLWLLLLLLWAL
jgi:hypothetical protein